MTEDEYGALLRHNTILAGVQLRILVNQLITFYIESPLIKNHGDAMGDF
jgi:hypothetical protein